jgi:hypothetical protein
VKARGPILAAMLSCVFLGLLSACAVTGVGVEGSVGYDGGYYEPYGYDYGGWGAGYRVGPSRCCERRDDHHDHPVDRGHPVGGRAGRSPAYHPAPAGRPAPSIPGRPRGH